MIWKPRSLGEYDDDSFVFPLFGLAGILVLAVACSPASNEPGIAGGGGTSAPPLSVNLIGPLQYLGDTALLQVSQPGFLGPIRSRRGTAACSRSHGS
uniref:Uncharacterized protein n=1 Tax=mine drainage metagenome TaxID=410659 RepID=E6PDS8_9ZZZZ